MSVETGETSEFSEGRKIERTDTDQDGADDKTENANPGRSGGGIRDKGAGTGQPGDGNDDGVQDSIQANVISFPNAVTLEYVTIESPAGTILSNAEAVAPFGVPDFLEFPYGLFQFEISGGGLTPGGATTAKIYLPDDDLSALTYFKQVLIDGGEQIDWFPFYSAGSTGAEFGVGEITLSFVDGERGDLDDLVDGAIVDPGGPAIFIPEDNAVKSWPLYP
jgi:hypothetical protein